MERFPLTADRPAPRQFSLSRASRCLLWLLLLLLMPSMSWAQDEASEAPTVRRNAEVYQLDAPYRFDGDIRDLPQARAWQPGDPIREVPRRHQPRPEGSIRVAPPVTPKPDPLLARQADAKPTDDIERATRGAERFPGLPFSGAQPPDPSGAAGTNFYVQSINAAGGTRVRVYNKATSAIVSTFTLSSLAAPGSPCNNGGGDGIVLYDHLAGRWFIAEFVNFFASPNTFLCLYVSQTGSPVVGGWFAYTFSTAPNFPDYPKFAITPTAYFATSNEANPALYAFDRATMLVGAPTTAIRFFLPPLAGFGFQALTPADLDGPASGGGTTGLFMRHRDDEIHGGSTANDFLEVWEMTPNFANPPLSTLVGPVNIAVPDFDSTLCGQFSFACIPQPGTPVLLDPLREVIMWRLQYRRFGNVDVLTGTFSVDVNGFDRAGIRWFILARNLFGPAWAVFDQGTFAPGTVNRWMGSVALDKVANLATIYNASSSTVFPELRVGGRQLGTPPGTWVGEVTLVPGGGSNTSNRYGDYNATTIDPVDDCTFWVTGEYNPTTTWSTWIQSFKFANCV